MNETIQASGWWLASDGNWYPPEQYTGTPATVLADAAPVQKGLSKGMTVLIGLAVILVLSRGWGGRRHPVPRRWQLGDALVLGDQANRRVRLCG